MFDFIDPNFTFFIWTNQATGKKMFVEVYNAPDYDFIREFPIN